MEAHATRPMGNGRHVVPKARPGLVGVSVRAGGRSSTIWRGLAVARNVVRFGILGSVEAWRDGEPVDLGAPKQRSVLAMLLVNTNRIVSVDRFIDTLWGEEPAPRATGALQVYISNLRRALAPEHTTARLRSDVIVTQSPGYLLRVGRDDLDAARMEDLAGEGHRLLAAGDPAAAQAAFVAALALWRGPALTEFAFEGFARTEAARLEELRLVALEGRLDADMALGAHAVAVPELESLVAQDPLRERLWALLMVALYRCGRQADALRAYRRVRSVLGEELGIDPGPDLRRLEGDVLAQSPSLDWRPRSITPAAINPEPTAPAPPSPDEAAIFVGRTDAIAVMERARATALSGRGRVVLVSGEPGIGKTRLVEEMLTRADTASANIAWGATYEGDGAPAFWPWVQVLESLAATDPDGLSAALAGGGSELTQVVPSLKELVGEIDPPWALDPAAARFQLFEAVSGVLTRLAARHPLVVVLDDLHWADAGSLQLAEYVAARLSTARVLLVATYRDVDPVAGEELTGALGVLARIPGLVRVALTGLNEAEVAQFIAHTSGVDPSEEEATAVWARTDGNPFFVQELARLLAAEGGLALASANSLAVPPGVRQVIRRRLARLPTDTNTLLTVAAVAGRTFDLRVVASAAAIGTDAAVGLADSAVASGVLIEDPASIGVYRFSHALVRDAIYGELSALRRARLHTLVGEALEKAGGRAATPVELAHHFSQAAAVIGPDKAVAYTVEAADQAQKALGHDTAESLLRQALALVERSPLSPERDRLELTVYERLASLLTLIRGIAAPETGDAWARVTELCGVLDERRRQLSSLWGMFAFSWAQGHFDDADQLAQQILTMGTTWNDPAVSAVALLGRGGAALFRGAFTQARDHLLEGRKLVGQQFDPALIDLIFTDIVANLDSYLGLVSCILDQPEDAVRYTAAAIDRARCIDHPFTLAVVLGIGLFTTSIGGRGPAARTVAEEVMEFAAAHQLADFYMAEVVREWAEAREAGDGAPELFAGRQLHRPEVSAIRLWQPCLLGLMAETARRVGRPDEALQTIAEALDEADTVGAHFYDAELYRLRAEILAETAPDQAEEAMAWLRRARTVTDEQGAVLFERRTEEAIRRLPVDTSTTLPQ